MQQDRLKLRYLFPALALAAVLTAGPIVALLGTTERARLLFVAVLGIVTVIFYHFRSWRLQAGTASLALGFEFILLVIVYFNPVFPWRRLVTSWVGTTWANIIWQATLGASVLLLIGGSLLLLWGYRAHHAKKRVKISK